MPSCPACPARVEQKATHCTACGASFPKPFIGIFESRITVEQEAAVQVPAFVQIALGLFAISGAAWGLSAIATLLAEGWPGLVLAMLVSAVALVYMFGAYVGVLALRRSPGWLRKNTVFWALQVPFFMSPVFSYSLASGGLFIIWVQVLPSLSIGVNYFLGSTFKVDLLSEGPFSLGVNLLALGIFVYLLRLQRKIKN